MDPIFQQAFGRTAGTLPLAVRVTAAPATHVALAATLGACRSQRAEPQVRVVSEAAVRAASGREGQTGVGPGHRVIVQVWRLRVRVEVMAGGGQSVRGSCSGLLFLRQMKCGWRTTLRSRGNVCAPATTATTAAHAALLTLQPSLGQKLLFCVTVGQSSDAWVGLPLGCALLGLNAASWHAVALHKP